MGLGGASRLQRALAACWAFAAVTLTLAITAGSASAACSNEAIREAQGATSLPGCLAFEMVSPAKKFVQPAFSPSFAPEGGRVLYTSTAGVGETEGLQSYSGDSYVASRTISAWATEPTSPPRDFLIANGSKFGGPFAFSPDLGDWLLFGSTQAENMVGITQFFHGDLEGTMTPLSPQLVPIDNSGSEKIVFNVTNTESNATAADLSTTVFAVKLLSTTYLPGDPVNSKEVNPGGDKNQYVAFRAAGGQPTIELLARDRFGTIFGSRCGTHVGGGTGSAGLGQGGLGQGAISSDGSRIYFTTRPAQPPVAECEESKPFRILERIETPAGPEITELVPGGPAAGSDFYQAASVDGSKVFFTTTRQLVPGDQDTGPECEAALGDSDGCDLYLYDKSKPPSERLTQVSAGGSGDPDPGKDANVLSSITAVSGDGTHAYFVAEGVLTTNPNPAGDTATAGEPNLYLYERSAAHPAGRTVFVGSLAAGDEGSLWGTERSFGGGAYAVPLRGSNPQIGGDGHILFLASVAPLTADDTDGGKRDLFRYDATAATLERISKAAPGGSETPPSDVFVNVKNGANPLANPAEERRWASEDGQTVAFATAEALVPGDPDGVENPYLWKAGALGRFQSEAGETPTVSTSGENAAFTTEFPLVVGDGDTAKDVYVAREGGGFAVVPDPIPCDPLLGACQAPLGAPAATAPASQSFSGPGNVKPQPTKPRCKKGFVRKHGKCVKKNNQKKNNPKKNGKQTKRKRGDSK